VTFSYKLNQKVLNQAIELKWLMSLTKDKWPNPKLQEPIFLGNPQVMAKSQITRAHFL